MGIVEVDAVAGMDDLPRLVPGINRAHEHRHSLPDSKSDGYLLAPQTLGSAAPGASGDLACVALAGGLSAGADEGADR